MSELSLKQFLKARGLDPSHGLRAIWPNRAISLRALMVLTITQFTASQTSVLEGEMVSLNWKVLPVSPQTSVTLLSGGHNLGSVPLNGPLGETPVYPQSIYQLIVTDPSGMSAKASLTVGVEHRPTATPPQGSAFFLPLMSNGGGVYTSSVGGPGSNFSGPPARIESIQNYNAFSIALSANGSQSINFAPNASTTSLGLMELFGTAEPSYDSANSITFDAVPLYVSDLPQEIVLDIIASQ